MKIERTDGIITSLQEELEHVAAAKARYSAHDYCFTHVTVESLLVALEQAQKNRVYQLTCTMVPTTKSKYKVGYRWLLNERFKDKAEVARFVASELKIAVSDAYDAVENWLVEEIIIGAKTTLRVEV